MAEAKGFPPKEMKDFQQEFENFRRGTDAPATEIVGTVLPTIMQPGIDRGSTVPPNRNTGRR